MDGYPRPGDPGDAFVNICAPRSVSPIVSSAAPRVQRLPALFTYHDVFQHMPKDDGKNNFYLLKNPLTKCAISLPPLCDSAHFLARKRAFS